MTSNNQYTANAMARAFCILSALIALIGFGWSRANAAVALEQCGAPQSVGTATFTNYAGLVVTAGNVIVVEFAVGSGAVISGVTARWDNAGTPQAMTAVSGSPAVANTTEQIYAFMLRNPTAGNKTLNITWTTSAEIAVFACSYTGADTTSDAAAVKNLTTASNAAPISVNAVAGANDLTLGIFVSTANFTSATPTQQWINNTMSVLAVAAASGGGSNPTFTGNPGSATSLAAVLTIAAPATACAHSLALLGAGC